MKKLLLLFFIIILCNKLFAQGNNYVQDYTKYNGLALTPPMGWNSWNKFACNVDEKLIKEIADAMVATGMKNAGYEYINIDDCWHGDRDSLGFIHPDPNRFPSGMKALADYIHSKGLKLGIYSDAGSQTCGGRPGSRGYEFQDALTYAKWGIDYLKYDWCNTEGLSAEGAYKTISAALKKAGRPVVLSICEWGNSKPWSWAENVGHLWRTTGDIYNCFDCVEDHGTWKSWGVMQILDMQKGLRKYAGPGHWNDPDMLEVGNGALTPGEDRAHFSIWAMIAAPLIAGNDLRSMSKETIEVLTNKEVIAVNQDASGVQAFRYDSVDGMETWYKPLQNGDWAVCYLNRSKTNKTVKTDWSKLYVTDSIFGYILNTSANQYAVKDLWQHKNLGNTSGILQQIVPAHDVLMLRLTKSKRDFSPVDKQATKETVNLFRNLKKIEESGNYMIGHQDDLAYGVHWKYEKGRSDVKDITGDYPAVYGWELGHLEIGDDVNLDSVPFDKMKGFIKDAYERGGVVTISWHGKNPMTGKTAWDPAEATVASILPGRNKHEDFKKQLDLVADFLNDLKTKNGTLIPILFRPFHELTGNWFWWGTKFTTAEEYKKLFRFTVDYLKNEKKLHHLIYVYNTGEQFTNEVEFLERYPGDDVVDMVSFDTYLRSEKAERNIEFENQLKQRLGIIETVAKKKNKLSAIGEAGFNKIPYEKWWTESIGNTLKGHHFSYILFWRNAGVKVKENEVEFYMPYKGHSSAPDFLKFYQLPETLFQKDISPLKMYK